MINYSLETLSEFCFAVWCSERTSIKLQERAVSGEGFLAGGVFECNIVHHRSASVLRMLYKIIHNRTHHLYGYLPVPYVPVRVARTAFIAYRYMCLFAEEPRSTARLLFPLSISEDRS